ncbi:MAG: HDIG domain-containing protein [Prevotellaceae bacterium]|jgi:putative nucleotidyltransferase with HDIG domain|nr:HDIG domain-containing protein [Prevotellaceae bacterium]
MKFIKKHKHLIPFIVGALLIVLFLPREGKFQYEFQKGKVWQHKTLNAPFDFPIYKTETELANEKRQTLNSVIPYYNRDSSVYYVQRSDLVNTFRTSLRTTYSSQGHGGLLQYNYYNLINKILPALQGQLRFIYGKGIREPNSVAENYLSTASATLVVITGNMARSFPSGECFTPQSAYLYLSNRLQALWSEGSVEQAFYSKLDVQSFLKPNLRFNEQITAQALEQRMAAISPTQGMVSAGQQIVAQGEVVTANTFGMLSSFRYEYEQRVGYSGNTWLLLLGHLLLTLLFMSMLFLYTSALSRRKVLTLKENSFLLLLVVSFFLTTLWVSRTGIASIYVIPFAALPIFVCTFFDMKLALLTHFVTTMLAAFIVPNSFEFFLITSVVGFGATYNSKDVYRRSKLYRTAAIILGVYCLTYIALTFIKDGSLTFDWRVYLWFTVNTALVVAMQQLVYVFEKIFGFTSDNTLMEISDTNNALLRELAEVAPATFQHSIQVANLAESVVRQIGGNPLLVRVGALYHDIGKMNNPTYFIENQAAGFSPHHHLDPEESARIIVRHVTDGVAIARKNRLPEIVVRFIRTHHGTSLVHYFYRAYREKYPEATDFSSFRYQGSNPTTKEQGVLMMADAVEAASRTLTKFTQESISDLVETVIASKVNGKMLENTDLTFNDISTAKAIFKKKLQNIYHDRIAVPVAEN